MGVSAGMAPLVHLGGLSSYGGPSVFVGVNHIPPCHGYAYDTQGVEHLNGLAVLAQDIREALVALW